MTQREVLQKIFENQDYITSPVKHIVEVAKKSYGKRVSPNLVSTVRQGIIKRNNRPVETDKLMELIQFGSIVKNLGGMQRVKNLIEIADNVGVNW